jgi:hypothetical protein
MARTVTHAGAVEALPSLLPPQHGGTTTLHHHNNHKLSQGVAQRTGSGQLLAILKREKLVLDWREKQRTRAAVRVAVDETLNRLPEHYGRQIYAEKCDAVYERIFDSYWDDGRSIYSLAA